MKFLLIISLVLSFSSCSNELSKNEYLKYLQDPENGLVKIVEINNIQIKCEYKPSDYVVLNQLSKQLETEKTITNTKDLLSEADDFITFYIKLSSTKENDFLKTDLLNKDQYYKRLNYYNSEIENDLILVQGKDTLQSNYTYLERNFGIGNESTLIVGFVKNKEKASENFSLILNEQALNLGQIKFDFLSEKINKVPKVKI